ncbi:haloacid dehalogenase-like hydrolase superfamily protein [Tanacetum coccineum]
MEKGEGKGFFWVEETNGKTPLPAKHKRRAKAATKVEFIGWGSKSLIEFLTSIGKDTGKQLSKFDVAAIINDYISTFKLLHPEKKKRVVCDDRLYSLFGKNSIPRNKIHELLDSHLAENRNSDSSEDDYQSCEEYNDGNITCKKSRVCSLEKKTPTQKKKTSEPLLSKFACVIPENLKLMFLKRCLVQELVKHPESFEEKLLGSYVRVKTDPNDYSQKNSFQLLPVTETFRQHYRMYVGLVLSDTRLQFAHQCEFVIAVNLPFNLYILIHGVAFFYNQGVKNILGKSEIREEVLLQVPFMIKDIPICKLSDDDFSKEECEELCQKVKDGLLKRPTVAEVEQKAQLLHEDIIKHVSNACYDPRDDGPTSLTLFEYLERKKLLETPSELTKLLTEIPKVTADILEPEATPQEQVQDIKLPNGKDVSHPTVNGGTDQALPSSGRDDAAEEDVVILGANGRSITEPVANVGSGIQLPTFEWVETETKISAQTSNLNKETIVIDLSDDEETTDEQKNTHEKEEHENAGPNWFYRDPQGNIQGPVSRNSLKSWSDAGYFLPDFTVWKDGQTPQRAILLTEMLLGSASSSVISRYQCSPSLPVAAKKVKAFDGPSDVKAIETPKESSSVKPETNGSAPVKAPTMKFEKAWKDRSARRVFGIAFWGILRLLHLQDTDNQKLLFGDYMKKVIISSVLEKQAWFLDQYGVLHDGKQPYPGATSTLEKLAARGAKMIIISNASRCASTTLDKLKSLGFDTSLFAGAITSGELTYQHLLRRDDPWFQELGTTCIHITWNDPRLISLEGLGLEVVQNVEKAEFVLVHGTQALGLPSGDSNSMKIEDLQKILEQCAAKKIPMVVANPDFLTVEVGATHMMPAMAMTGIDASESIAVGDSLLHDIKGANASGIESAFITCGIHSTELGLRGFGEVADPLSVNALALKYDAYPSYVLPSFTWYRNALKPIKIEMDRLSEDLSKLSRSINGVSFKNEFLGGDISDFVDDLEPLMVKDSDNVVKYRKGNEIKGSVNAFEAMLNEAKGNEKDIDGLMVLNELYKNDVKCNETELKVNELDNNNKCLVGCGMFDKEDYKIKEKKNRTSLSNLVPDSGEIIDVKKNKLVNEDDEINKYESLSFDEKLDVGLEPKLVAETTTSILCSSPTIVGANEHTIYPNKDSHVHMYSNKILTCDDQWYKQEEGFQKVSTLFPHLASKTRYWTSILGVKEMCKVRISDLDATKMKIVLII